MWFRLRIQAARFSQQSWESFPRRRDSFHDSPQQLVRRGYSQLINLIHRTFRSGRLNSGREAPVAHRLVGHHDAVQGRVDKRHGKALLLREREFFVDEQLVRIHFITEMVQRTGLAPWVFELPFPGILKSRQGGTGRSDLRPPVLRPQTTSLNPSSQTSDHQFKPRQGSAGRSDHKCVTLGAREYQL